MRCPKCGAIMDEPRELRDGLPGILYRECGSCGYTRAVTQRQRRERLPERREENPGIKLFTVSNTKTKKGEALGYRTFILHLVAASGSGIANVCAYASSGCKNICLIGQGRMSMARKQQMGRTALFFDDRDKFFEQLYDEIARGVKSAERAGYIPVFRLNGTSDLPWERIGPDGSESVIADHPHLQFYDYTKYAPDRRHGYNQWGNYHLTFSWSEGPEKIAPDRRQEWVLAAAAEWHRAGVNTTVVFGRYAREQSVLPSRYDIGFGSLPVIDGDESDLRFLDPVGVIVGLRAKFKSYSSLEAAIKSGFVQPGTYGARARNPPDLVREEVGSKSLADVHDFDLMARHPGQLHQMQDFFDFSILD